MQIRFWKKKPIVFEKFDFEFLFEYLKRIFRWKLMILFRLMFEIYWCIIHLNDYRKFKTKSTDVHRTSKREEKKKKKTKERIKKEIAMVSFPKILVNSISKWKNFDWKITYCSMKNNIIAKCKYHLKKIITLIFIIIDKKYQK